MHEAWAKNKTIVEFFPNVATKEWKEKVDLIKQEMERKVGIRKCEFKVGCVVLCKTGLVERCLWLVDIVIKSLEVGGVQRWERGAQRE